MNKHKINPDCNSRSSWKLSKDENHGHNEQLYQFWADADAKPFGCGCL